jgi:hypothetical protein
MNDNKELTPAQKRKARLHDFNQRYGQYWLIYSALICTAALSFVSGMVLPFRPDDNGNVVLTFGGIALALYFGVGFVSNGEGAAGFWFEKLTDHDKDNNPQKWIAGIMLAASVIVSLVTSLAAAAQLAFLLGVLSEFQEIPVWAQDWIVWSIPTMWIANAVSGMAFKAVSDEADAEREANSIIREAKLEVKRARENARANYWKENATAIFTRLGELDAEDEINTHAARLNGRQPANKPLTPARQFSAETEQLADPTRGGK